MTTAQGKPAPQPSSGTKASQVRRITAALERRLAGPSTAVLIVRTLGHLKRKNG